MINEPVYKIGDVAKALDITQATIRYWQSEIPELTPKYSTPQRRFTAKDVELLKYVKYLVYEKGFPISRAKEIVNAQKNRGRRPVECKSVEDAVKYLRKAKIALAENIRVALMLDEVEKYIIKQQQ